MAVVHAVGLLMVQFGPTHGCCSCSRSTDGSVWTYSWLLFMQLVYWWFSLDLLMAVVHAVGLLMVQFGPSHGCCSCSWSADGSVWTYSWLLFMQLVYWWFSLDLLMAVVHAVGLLMVQFGPTHGCCSCSWSTDGSVWTYSWLLFMQLVYWWFSLDLLMAVVHAVGLLMVQFGPSHGCCSCSWSTDGSVWTYSWLLFMQLVYWWFSLDLVMAVVHAVGVLMVQFGPSQGRQNCIGLSWAFIWEIFYLSCFIFSFKYKSTNTSFNTCLYYKLCSLS